MGRVITVLAGLLALALAVPAAIAVTGGLGAANQQPLPATSATSATAPNLLANGDFSSGVAGWETVTPKRQHLGTALLVDKGETVASLSRFPSRRRTNASAPGRVELVNTDLGVQTTAGQLYAVVADVRASGQTVRGELRLRETKGGAKSGLGVTEYRIKPGGWTSISLMYVARTSGATLRVSLRGQEILSGTRLLVDNVALVAVGAIP